MFRMTRLLTALCCATMLAVGAASTNNPLVFTGMCDASAAAAVDDDLFVVANDEDNILRFYRLSQPGKQVQSCNLNPLLFAKKKSPEMDLEGAARIDQRIFWIASHGRKASGEPAPKRHQLFALELNSQKGKVAVKQAGKVYNNLISDLSRDSKFARFRLAEAAAQAPESRGGLNIEALTDTPDKALLIGFRNPIPEGRALIVPLLNPNELLAGQLPRFGDPILLDLGGLGLRGMGSTKTGYYLLAGPAAGKGQCRLFFWEGSAAKPQPVTGMDFSDISLEGICFHDVGNRSDLLVLSDDGARNVNGMACKDLPESQRQFRAFRVSR